MLLFKLIGIRLSAGSLIALFFVLLTHSHIPYYYFNITIQTDLSGVAQLYYDTGNGFNENQSYSINIRPGKNQYSLPLYPNVYKKLRFDPTNRDGTISFSFATITDIFNNNFLTIPITSFVPNNQIEEISYSINEAKLKVRTGASDPIFLMKYKYPIVLPINFFYLTGVFLIVFFLMLIIYYYKLPTYFEFQDKSYVPLFLVIVMGLILSMATLSAVNRSVHPDEFSHTSVGIYYFNHWLPPYIGDPNTISTYSEYGFSYINELDIVYLLAAKVAKLIIPLVGNDVLVLRFFNIFLFSILLIYVFIKNSSRWILLLFLVSPQIWYIFSYFNADAFSLFLSTILICMFMEPSSSINRYVRGKQEKLNPGVVIFIGLLSSLFLSKINYYIFIPFLMYYYFLSNNLIERKILFISCLGFFVFVFSILCKKGDHLNEITLFVLQASGIILALSPIAFIKDILNRFIASGIYPQKWLIVLCISFTVITIRVGYDFYLNGTPSQKSEKIVVLAENLAGESFKPSNYGKQNSYIGLALKSKGVSFTEIFNHPYYWGKISLNSFFGIYGYMSIALNSSYYLLIISLFFILIFSIFFQVLKPFNIESISKVLLLLFFIFLTILISAHHSWVSDFQAQGRYLFPILPMLGLFIADNKNKIKNSWFDIMFIAIFCLSVYSFLFGIYQIPK